MRVSGLRKQLEAGLADTITAIIPVGSSALVADSTEKYIVHTNRTEYILIVSNEIAPLLVKRGTDRQREVRARLPGIAADAIELPVHEGWTADRSYAVWIRRQPLSTNRARARIQEWLLAPRVYKWLKDVAVSTTMSVPISRVIANLQRLSAIASLPEPIKVATQWASAKFQAGEIPLVQVVQHGDLWIGNILRAPSKTGFIVIDWAGARLDGAPFFDVVNFALSVRSSTSTLRRSVNEHSRTIGCAPHHSVAYVLSGLGALHTELEFFPEDRFLSLCESIFQALHNLFEA